MMGQPLVAPPVNSFNSLLLYSSASATANSGSSVALTNIVFVSSSLTQAGSGSWVEATALSSQIPRVQYQQLYSNVDLATIDWTLSGTVSLFKDGTGGDESVKFVIYTRNVNFN